MARSAGASQLPLPTEKPSTGKGDALSADCGSGSTLSVSKGRGAKILTAKPNTALEWLSLVITPEEARLLVNLEMPERVQALLTTMLAFMDGPR